MKTTTTRFSFYAALCLLLASFPQPSHADITATGDVDPADPATWTTGTYGYIGKTGDGTLDITSGGTVSNYRGYIGYNPGSTGAVTVDGIGSTWTNSSILNVGQSGNGTLIITSGGTVSNGSGSIGIKSGSTSTVTVDGTGSTWTNSGLFLVGAYGNGTLDITSGGTVSNNYGFNNYGYIGYASGSTGAVTVDGTSSTWTNSDDLYVGYQGDGTLDITSGGMVSNNYGFIGDGSGSTGAVAVDGTGSTWANSSDLLVGDYGNGTLDITSGGLVSVARTLTIDEDLDGGSFINMANGGMLALNGKGDDSLISFLDMIEGTDAIRYWNETNDYWSHISNATYGEDYTLEYLTEGDLSGYTKLTVGVIPEPSSMLLLCLGAFALLGFGRSRRK